MSESAHSLEVAKAQELPKGLATVGGNNLRLADQFQFSSILKVLVDPPEKKIQAAQTPVDPVEERLARRAEFKREFGAQRTRGDDTERGEKAPVKKREPAKEIHESSRPADKPKTENKAPAEAPQRDKPQVLVDEEDIKQSVPLFRPDAGDEPASEFAALTGTALNVQPVVRTGETPVVVGPVVRETANVTSDAPRPDAPPAQLNRGAQLTLAGALAEANQADFADDLHQATNGQQRRTSAATASQTAPNSLAAKQASDIANRLAFGNQINIQVNVSDQAGNVRATPSQSLTPGAELAQVSTLPTDGKPTFAPGTNGQNQANANAGRGNDVDPQALLGRQPSANGNQDQLIFTQMIRAQAAQAANAATQQAQAAATATTPKTAPVASSDVIQTNSTAGPTGPSQVSQTAKANPTTAARQPQHTQAPAEQVAVQIKKALGAGADKINIKLHPEHLGRVEVRLEVGRDGHIQATIMADKPETLELLQRDARGLEKALQEAGLRTTSDSLSFSLRGDGQQRAEADRSNGQNRDPLPSERDYTPEEDRDQGILMNQNVYGRNMATDGGVNIVI